MKLFNRHELNTIIYRRCSFKKRRLLCKELGQERNRGRWAGRQAGWAGWAGSAGSPEGLRWLLGWLVGWLALLGGWAGYKIG